MEVKFDVFAYVGNIPNERNIPEHHPRLQLENECHINQSKWAICFLIISLILGHFPEPMSYSFATLSYSLWRSSKESASPTLFLGQLPSLTGTTTYYFYRAIEKEHGLHADHLPICTGQSCNLKQSLLSACHLQNLNLK